MNTPRCTSRMALMLGALINASCAGLESAPPRPAPPVSAQVGVPAGAPLASAAVKPEAPAAVAKAAVTPLPAPASAQAPMPVPVPVPVPARVRPEIAASPAVKIEAPPPLDLKSLETRLKETKAIGVFTKLTVKNQVDELLDRFRAFYAGRLQTSLAELRRSYDQLVVKVLALLQDADAPLAKAIAASRESIWGILSNPARFSKI